MIRGVLVAVGAVALVVGLVLSVERVRHHVDTEVASTSAPRLASERGELLREALHAGQRVVFEACSVEPDAFGPAFRDRLAFEVVVVPMDETALSVTLDDARIRGARRSAQGVCVDVGNAPSLGASGVFALRMRPVGEPPHVARHIPVVGRIVAVTNLSDADVVPVLLALLGATLLVIASGGPPTGALTGARVPAGRALAATSIAVAALVFALFSGGLLPRWGALTPLMNAGLVALVELGAAALVPRALGVPARELLGLSRPRVWAFWLAAPIVGVLLHVVGSRLAELVPSTGVAPIETLVAQTSGFLAVALVSVLAPAVEELFFRGVVYGAVAEARGENTACLVAFVVFVVVHVPQGFGAWGALASIALTGAALVGLRRASGSVLVPALAHLVHNAAITLLGFAARA